MVIASNVFAGFSMTSVQLVDSSKNKLINYAITSAATVTTREYKVQGNVGFATLYVKEDKAGGAGSVDIYAEYSHDGTTWYTPYSSDMAGSILADGDIVAALGNQERMIVFTPRPAEYIRFKILANADSEIDNAIFTYQEQY